jgi:hypothetical protein
VYGVSLVQYVRDTSRPQRAMSQPDNPDKSMALAEPGAQVVDP